LNDGLGHKCWVCSRILSSESLPPFFEISIRNVRWPAHHRPWPTLIASLSTTSSSFNSLFRVLLIFPLRYLFAIGLPPLYLALGGVYHLFGNPAPCRKTPCLEVPSCQACQISLCFRLHSQATRLANFFPLLSLSLHFPVETAEQEFHLLCCVFPDNLLSPERKLLGKSL